MGKPGIPWIFSGRGTPVAESVPESSLNFCSLSLSLSLSSLSVVRWGRQEPHVTPHNARGSSEGTYVAFPPVPSKGQRYVLGASRGVCLREVLSTLQRFVLCPAVGLDEVEPMARSWSCPAVFVSRQTAVSSAIPHSPNSHASRFEETNHDSSRRPL
jgi:hypothetical protein